MSDNFTKYMCRLPGNLGDVTYWKPQGLSRPVQGLLSISQYWPLAYLFCITTGIRY